ncbi:MAG TPA: hypothetical protein VL652_04195 [Kutzneria sp.]|nr:hypothetical protein [Kutzneria sp.]
MSARVVNGAIRWYDEVGVVVRAGAVDVHVAPPEQVVEHRQDRDRSPTCSAPPAVRPGL